MVFLNDFEPCIFFGGGGAIGGSIDPPNILRAGSNKPAPKKWQEPSSSQKLRVPRVGIDGFLLKSVFLWFELNEPLFFLKAETKQNIKRVGRCAMMY